MKCISYRSEAEARIQVTRQKKILVPGESKLFASNMLTTQERKEILEDADFPKDTS